MGLMMVYGIWAYFSGKVYVHYGNYTKKDHKILFYTYVLLYVSIPTIFYIFLIAWLMVS